MTDPTVAPVAIGPCQGCGACLLTCPTHAIRPTPAGLLVRADRCTGCLECLEICPVDAIRVTEPETIRRSPMSSTAVSVAPPARHHLAGPALTALLGGTAANPAGPTAAGATAAGATVAGATGESR